MRINPAQIRRCLELLFAAFFVLLTVVQLKEPLAMMALDVNAQLTARAPDVLRATVEEVATRTDVQSSSATAIRSPLPSNIEQELTVQNPSLEFARTVRPVKSVFHRRLLPPSPDDAK
jgi:hypothetical protein